MMHPELVRAIILAAFTKTPDGTKRGLVSTAPGRREQAEGAIAVSIVVALAQHH